MILKSTVFDLKKLLVAKQMIQLMYFLTLFFEQNGLYIKRMFRWTVGQVSGNPRSLQISSKHAERAQENEPGLI